MKRSKELPLLAGIASFIRWVEELANLIAGPLLTLGLGIALVDLLTEGKLLATVPVLLFAWAITQAIGVDAQLVALWDRAHIALREHRYGALVASVVLGLVLAYVAWIAAQVFALQESEGISTSAALARLGMDPAIWLIQRTALSVFLVCLAGWSRYHAPDADVDAETAQERARLEADLTLEPLRQQKRAMQVGGMRSLALSAIGRETPPRPPTGPGTPTRQVGVRTPAVTGAPNVVEMRPAAQATPRRKRRSQRVARGSVEALARQHFYPGISVNALQSAAGISRASAQKYHAMLTAEKAVQ